VIAATLRWHITGCDIGNAYLEALTNRNLYMELPIDYTGLEHRVVVRLIRNLYGSKQAAYMWYTLLCRVLMDYGFEHSTFEPCCFIYNKNSKYIIVCVYVDDLLITGNNREYVEDVKIYLSQAFNKIKDLKNVEKYLGLKMIRNGNGQLILNQNEYIESILKEFQNKEIKIKIRNTPLPHNLKPLVEIESGDQPNILEDLLGKLRYLADRTRPDIAFVASFIARFAINPTVEHTQAIFQTIGYLDKTRELGLLIGSLTKQINLFAMSDTSFIRDDNSKGQLSYSIIFLADDAGAFYTKSQKDKSATSISSFHSEINAPVEAVKMIIYYRGILEELKYTQNHPTVIYADNQNVIMVSNNIMKDNRSMYLTNKINFLREQIDNRIISLQYIESEKNVADLGTKSLRTIPHNELTAKLLH
jgi:hypothetical protein